MATKLTVKARTLENFRPRAGAPETEFPCSSGTHVFQDFKERPSRRPLGDSLHGLNDGGTDIRYVQAFLRHESLDTTKTYLRLVPADLRKAYDAAMPDVAVSVGA